jgi:hypothetical protein
MLTEEGRCHNHLLHNWGTLVLSVPRMQRTFEFLQASQDRRKLPVLRTPKCAGPEAVVLSITVSQQPHTQKQYVALPSKYFVQP